MTACRFCGVRIVQKEYPSGKKWVHEREAGINYTYVFCKITEAAPLNSADD